MAKKITFFSVLVAIAFLLTKMTSATDYSSSSFKVKNPILQAGGQKSTSNSFQLFGSIGQISIGTSTSSSFKNSGGFLYFSAFIEAATSTVFNSATGGSTTLTNIDNTGVVFNIPTNFYSKNLQLQANSYTNSFFVTNKPAPSGGNFIGKVYDFNFYDTSGNSISAVSKPVTITLTYADSDIIGFDENALAPYRWGSSDSSWQLISGATVDTVNNKVTFSTAHFSSFALFSQQTSQTAAGGNYSMYLESLLKLAAFPLLPADIKPCNIAFDFNCDGSVDLKDFSIFLGSKSAVPSNPKSLSVFLSSFTGKFVPFVSERVPSEIEVKTDNLFNFKKTATISLFQKPAVKIPERTPTLAQASKKPGFIENTFQFISNIFNKIIRLFVK